MSTLPDTRSFHPRPEAVRQTLRLFGLAVLLSVLVAALLTVARPSPGSFWRNRWFSECIGLWLMTSALLVCRLPWLRNRLSDEAAARATSSATTAWPCAACSAR